MIIISGITFMLIEKGLPFTSDQFEITSLHVYDFKYPSEREQDENGHNYRGNRHILHQRDRR